MAQISEMYERVKSVVESVDSSVYMYGSEGTRGVTIGKKSSIPQTIEVEFNGTVPDSLQTELLQTVNGTGWEFVDEDDVFNGDNSGGGLITVSRDVDPEEISTFDEFARSEDL